MQTELNGFDRHTERTRLFEQRQELQRLIDTLSPVTSSGAIGAAAVLYDAQHSPTPIDEKTLKFAIDAAAVQAMERSLHGQDRYHVRTLGCEGKKEVHHYGEEAACLRDHYGHSYGIPLWVMIDPIEGTTRAARGREGAVSIMAVSPQGGIAPIPDGVHYADKLVGPGELNGKLSLQVGPLENLSIAVRELGIRAKELHVYVLERDRNASVIAAARQLGVTLHLLDSGDLMPALSAVSNTTTPTIVAGVGGFEEAMITAAAAKVLDGFIEVQPWTTEAVGPIADVNHIIPGDKHSIVVLTTALTRDPYFGLQPVRTADDAIFTETLSLSILGAQFHHHRVTTQ